MSENIKNTEMDLSNLGQLLKSKMQLVEFESAQIKSLKQEIKEIMIQNDMKEFENPDLPLYIKCTRSFSFDIGAFKLEMPGFSASFITQEIITKTRDILDKKRLKERYPDDYKKFLIELTPRLKVK
jgi:hypothetical protein